MLFDKHKLYRYCDMMNQYWLQAGITWELVNVLPKEWSCDKTGSLAYVRNARDIIWSLGRDQNTGEMTNKPIRKKLFLNDLLPEHSNQLTTYDVYLFDFIGRESQGCCISRETHTVVLGVRSTKGYTEPTIRPLHCLAKTMAHELGHAVGLGHPNRQCFRDGTSCTLIHGRDNLMIGGIDSKGGGGCKLEDWQIVIARRHAETFLDSLNNISI